MSTPIQAPGAGNTAASNYSTSLDNPSTGAETDAAALGSSQSVGFNQQSISDFAATQHSVDSLKNYIPESQVKDRNSISYSEPKPAGTVTNGVPNNGQFPSTVTTGDPSPVTATTSRGVGEQPRITGVTATARPAEGVTVTAGGRPAAGTTPASVSAGVSVATPIGNGTTLTGGASISQPIGGAASTTTINAAVQRGTGSHSFQAGVNVYQGANAGSQVNVRVPLVGNSSATFTGTNRQNEVSSGVTVNAGLGANTNIGVGVTNNAGTGETRGTVGFTSSW